MNMNGLHKADYYRENSKEVLQEEVQQLREHSRALQDALAFGGHQWRNQLTILRIVAEKLLREVEGPLNPNQRRTVEDSLVSISHLHHVSEQYLSLARIEDTQMHLKHRMVNPVQEIIEPIKATNMPLLHQAQIEFEVNLSNPSLSLWGDPKLLYTVMDNLVANAIKYGEQNGKIVVSVAERGFKDEISLWNSGPGIPKEQLHTIFERFSRNDEQSEAGYGIGLYLARKIVEAHGGTLWADSTPGSWARFTFTLPKHGAQHEYPVVERDNSSFVW